MPLPAPKAKESHDKFMVRCMGHKDMTKEFPDEKQRYAVCQKQWDDKDKKSQEAQGIERRYFPLPVEVRADDGEGAKKLAGYAAVFDSMTDIGWFREKIAPGAFLDTAKEDDIRCLFNHNPDLILGRNKAGTLAVNEDEKGLWFENDVPDTQVGRDTLTSVERGDVTGCSFSFRTVKDQWDESDPDHPVRTLLKVKVYDVGPVTFPAYVDTSVAARSLEALRSERREEAPDTTEAAPTEPAPPAEPKSSASAEPPEPEVPSPEQLARDAKAQALYDQCGTILERGRPAKS